MKTSCFALKTPSLKFIVTKKLLLLACALILTAGIVHAGNLYVPNFSFESQPTQFADPRVDAWQKTPQPGTFDTNIFGEWFNLNGVFANVPPTNSEFIDNADGAQLGYLFAYPQVGLFQDYNSVDWSGAPATHAFNSKFTPGKSYTLTVGLTSSQEEPLTQGSTLLLSLYYRDVSNNVVTVASTVVTYDTNVFTNLTHLLDFSVSVPAVQPTNAWANQNIGISIESIVDPQLIGGVWDLDNVRLTESINVPNFSFESQVTPFADPRVDSWEKPPQPATFDTNIFGAWDNLAGVFANVPPTNADYIDNADGNQLAFIFAYPQVALFQDYNSTDWTGNPPTHAFNALFTPGKAYKLTVGLTSSQEEPLSQGETLLISLYYRDISNNMVTVAANNVAFDTNVFTNLNHLLDFSAVIPEVHATDPWANQNIGIQFMYSSFSVGGVWDLDNVRLSETVATAIDNPTQTNGQFTFTLQSEPNLHFEILTSTNPALTGTNWTSLGAFTNVTGSYIFTDSVTNQQRFYRAHQLP